MDETVDLGFEASSGTIVGEPLNSVCIFIAAAWFFRYAPTERLGCPLEYFFNIMVCPVRGVWIFELELGEHIAGAFVIRQEGRSR